MLLAFILKLLNGSALLAIGQFRLFPSTTFIKVEAATTEEQADNCWTACRKRFFAALKPN